MRRQNASYHASEGKSILYPGILFSQKKKQKGVISMVVAPDLRLVEPVFNSDLFFLYY